MKSLYVSGFLLLSSLIVCAQDKIDISNSVDISIAHTQRESYVTRIKTIHKLGRNLTNAEVKAIYEFLAKKTSESKLSNLEFNALKNELVIVLMKQRRYPEKLTLELSDMFFNKELGITWRDYCIQFLGQWYSKTQTSKERELTRRTLFAALEEQKNGIAGTALIALKPLVNFPGVNKQKIAEIAQSISEDTKAFYLNRIPALQISAALGNTQAIKTARKIINTENPVMLRMSALAVLGMHGSTADLTLLKKHTKSNDIRIRTAALRAVKKLEARLNSPNKK